MYGVDFVFVGSSRLRERFVFEVKVHRLSFHSRVTRFAALFPTLAARASSPEGSPAGTPAGPRDDSQLFFTPRFFPGRDPDRRPVAIRALANQPRRIAQKKPAAF